jgi:hypothetical protein
MEKNMLNSICDLNIHNRLNNSNEEHKFTNSTQGMRSTKIEILEFYL